MAALEEEATCLGFRAICTVKSSKKLRKKLESFEAESFQMQDSLKKKIVQVSRLLRQSIIYRSFNGLDHGVNLDSI